MCVNDYSANDIGWGLLLRRGEVANAYLWRSGRPRGYCVLIHRGDPHIAEPTDLSEADAAAYWRDTLALGRALTAFYEPIKLTYSTYGSISLPHRQNPVLSARCEFLDGKTARQGRHQVAATRWGCFMVEPFKTGF
ncbi:histidine triad (HIT) protein [Streptomyces venezuelae]|uniref:histidine triad (HIT) protein n=1 Tax=Streptomyces venezuelae TaxID=54571 RepID=UPI000D9D1C26|nr:histidine triad (HIT) protein [Streptomyces venezuelae]